MLKNSLFIFILTSLSLFAFSQKANFRYYAVADGLPQNNIHGIAQDAQGFIWVNAGQHLTRFDGAKFLSHTNTTHPVFNRNKQGFAEMQADGDLLVYCVNGQIISTNTLSGEESALPVAERLPAGYDANYGHCLRLASGAVVAVYPAAATGKVAMLRLEKGKPTRMVEVSGVNAMRENFYFTIHEDALGNLFFWSKDYDAVLKFDHSGRRLQAFPMPNIPINGILRMLPGRNNSVLLTHGHSIFRLEEGASTFQAHPANQFIQIGHNSIMDLVETPEGNFWAACSKRHLLFYDAGQNMLFDYYEELASYIPDLPSLNKFTLDKSGNLWATTEMGVLRVMPDAALFDTYFTEQHANCPGFCSFRGFAEDERGSIYASFYNNIFKISSPKDRKSNYAALTKGDVGPFDLLFYKGNLMLNKGVVLDVKTGIQAKPYPNAPYTFDWGGFASDAQGNLWWGTGKKVFLLEEQVGSPVWKEIANLPETGNIADIAFDPHKGMLWLGIESSLWTLDPVSRQLKRHGEDQVPMLNKLKCVYPDGKGNIWLATEKGLVHYEYSTNKWRRYTQSDGLPSGIVVGILPEGDSCLWLSTYNGLSRFSIGSGRFFNFNKQDGLADNEFNRASHFRASDGRMYFGGTRGVTAFYPKEVMASFAKQKPTEKLLLRGITLSEDGSDSTFTQLFPNPGQPLHVYHPNRTLFFEFSLLNSNAQTQYSYMLDGLNEDWSAPTKDDDPLLNSLPAGKYTFRARATDARGHWLPEQIAVPLIVHPSWWASWWAYLFYAIVLAGIAYGVFYFLKKRWELQTQLQQEQQEAERLKELDAFKSRLFTNITHEFRTPLTVLLGMAGEGRLEIEKLKNWKRYMEKSGNHENLAQISDNLVSNFQLIERNGQNLLRLVNQLLDLSKLEDKSFKLQLRNDDIVPFLRYVTESFQSLANARNLSLRFFTTLEKLQMDFDPDQIQQVMSNLLSNAIKFTPPGGEIKVDIKILRYSDIEILGYSDIENPKTERLARHPNIPISQYPNIPISQYPNTLIPQYPNILISVSDTGIGIPAADLPYIFDRFYQADGPTARSGEGTGIGLAHTLELVKIMGGEISADSPNPKSEGAGTVFTVRLPITNQAGFANDDLRTTIGKPSAAQQASPPDSQSSLAISHSETPSLLIIEDNADVVVYLKSILKDSYQTDVAYNGRIGIEMALESIPDLIISDVMMPEKDGYQVLETLKNDERTSHIPIMLLTAKADAVSRIAGLRRGADAYIPKPFDKAELMATLGMMADNRRRLVAHFAAGAPVLTKTSGGSAAQQEIIIDAAFEIEDAFMQKVRRIVAENCADEGFALPQLCLKIGMSRSQLFRKMKALTNESPSDFIRNYRIQQARILLETTGLSVKEVAYKVGFKDIPHFSRTYQETYGIPPSATAK